MNQEFKHPFYPIIKLEEGYIMIDPSQKCPEGSWAIFPNTTNGKIKNFDGCHISICKSDFACSPYNQRIIAHTGIPLLEDSKLPTFVLTGPKKRLYTDENIETIISSVAKELPFLKILDTSHREDFEKVRFAISSVIWPLLHADPIGAEVAVETTLSSQNRMKADQHWDMAGLARQDNNKEDEIIHTRLAKKYQRNSCEEKIRIVDDQIVIERIIYKQQA